MSPHATAAGPELVNGGASAHVLERLLRIHLGDRRDTVRLAITLAVITWLPLLLLSLAQGLALPGNVSEPFFRDITPHVRFLLALPLLIIADLIVGPRLNVVGSQFVASGLVRDRDLPRFEAIVSSAKRSRESRWTEMAVLAIAVLTTVLAVRRELSAEVSSWGGVVGPLGAHLTLPGWYYAVVSIPIFQFILFRWVLRLLVWAVFMFRVSRLDLQLTPTHPDRVAGLGFLGEALPPTSVILLAGSSVFCSAILTQAIYRGAKPQEFAPELVAFVLIVIVAFLAPFLVFTPKLMTAKRHGLMEYGALATQYTQLFADKWVSGGAEPTEPLLASADIQSLADMGNSFDRVASMRLFPVGWSDLKSIVLAALVPAVPLALTQVPLEKVMQMLMKLVF